MDSTTLRSHFWTRRSRSRVSSYLPGGKGNALSLVITIKRGLRLRVVIFLVYFLMGLCRRYVFGIELKSMKFSRNSIRVKFVVSLTVLKLCEVKHVDLKIHNFLQTT